MENLKVLALGRNQIKKIENLDSVAESLEELWISYNVLERLVTCCQKCSDKQEFCPGSMTLPTLLQSLRSATMQTGVEKLAALRVFLLSNNKIASWGEVERLGSLTALEELLLVGNPLYNEFKDKGDTQNYRIEVCFACSWH